MRLALGLGLVLVLGACAPCDPRPTIALASRGDPAVLHAVGELGDPRVPFSSAAQDPRMDEAMAALVPWLKSEDPYLRIDALEGMRRLAERARDVYRDRFPGVIDALLEDPEAEIRWRAAWTLGRLELLSSAPALRKATADRDDRVVDRALWALGRCRDDAAFPELGRALGRGGRITAQAMRALDRITGETLGNDPVAWKTWIARHAAPPPATPPGGQAPYSTPPLPPAAPRGGQAPHSTPPLPPAAPPGGQAPDSTPAPPPSGPTPPPSVPEGAPPGG